MLSFSVLTPYYKEDVRYSIEELNKENEDGISILFYLRKIYPEWIIPRAATCHKNEITGHSRIAILVNMVLTELEAEERLSYSCEKGPAQDEVVAAGGLHVVGTERHESRRIDNQLRGRSGRQGDPGGLRFFLSLEDNIFRIFGGDQIQVIYLMCSCCAGLFNGNDLSGSIPETLGLVQTLEVL
ncbi:hypothetical protein AHAS_Ahas20G0126600 [Arachis hypogaea]